jgi:hypothetical protein
MRGRFNWHARALALAMLVLIASRFDVFQQNYFIGAFRGYYPTSIITLIFITYVVWLFAVVLRARRPLPRSQDTASNKFILLFMLGGFLIGYVMPSLCFPLADALIADKHPPLKFIYVMVLIFLNDWLAAESIGPARKEGRPTPFDVGLLIGWILSGFCGLFVFVAVSIVAPIRWRIKIHPKTFVSAVAINALYLVFAFYLVSLNRRLALLSCPVFLLNLPALPIALLYHILGEGWGDTAWVAIPMLVLMATISALMWGKLATWVIREKPDLFN